MSSLPQTMQEVRAINNGSPFTRPIREWKAQGKQIIGWGCTYVPEEIIWAAGLLPVRVNGSDREIQTHDADAHICLNMCSYVRTILQLGLDGAYDFLDGYVNTASCDSTHRLLDLWRHYLRQMRFVHTLTLPRRATTGAENLFVEELQVFRRRLEESFHIEIPDDALRGAIRLYNRTRRLLGEIHDLRRSADPPLLGSEVVEVVNAGVRMPRENYNMLLERLLQEVGCRDADHGGKPRLMISGSNLGNPDLIAGIEHQGAVVVVDALCTGVRYFGDLVSEDPDLDPIRALAHRYLNALPCAPTVGLAEIRYERLIRLATEYRVQGLVNLVVRNCAPNIFERPLLRNRFEEAGIPVLDIDMEYGAGCTGQIATRVQAFLEMVGTT